MSVNTEIIITPANMDLTRIRYRITAENGDFLGGSKMEIDSGLVDAFLESLKTAKIIDRRN